MTITIQRKGNKERGGGEAPLWLRVTHQRKQRYLALGVYVAEKEWDPGRGRVRGRTRRAADLNAFLARAEQLAADAVAAMRRDSQAVTADGVRDAVATELAPERYAQPAQGDFLAFARELVEGYERRGQHRSYMKHKAVLAKLSAFLREHAGEPKRAPVGERTVAFDAFTPTLARRFKDLMILPEKEGGHGNGDNTAAVNVKIVRTWCRAAIREGLMAKDPTQAVRLKERAAEKERLNRAEVGRIAALGEAEGVGDGTAYAPGRRWGKGKDDGALLGLVRDTWMFSLYLAGIRFGDVAEMRFEHVRRVDGKLRLVYRMQKTDEAKSLPLIGPAAEIYERYREARAKLPASQTGGRIFPYLDGRTDAAGRWESQRKRTSSIGSANAVANRYLKRIAVLSGLAESEGEATLTFHMARHSFADVARKSGVGVYEISKALGHSSVQITERYLSSFDRDRVDYAMEGLF